MYPDAVEEDDEQSTRGTITPLVIRHPEAEQGLADIVIAILNRLDILESHFTPAGLDILSETLERRLANKLRMQGGMKR